MSAEMSGNNAFSFHLISAKDYIRAVTFSPLQVQHLENQLCMYANQKINLSAEDYPAPEIYIRAQEYHRGLMDGMRFLIEVHNAYKNEAVEGAREQARNQQQDQPVDDGYRIAGVDSGDGSEDVRESSSNLEHGD